MSEQDSGGGGAPPAGRSRWWKVSLLLLVVLVAVDGVAIWGIFAGRRAALDLAREDLELQTRVHARSLEAVLANLWADFLFLSQASPITRFPPSRDDPDAMARRWRRLDIEGTLLLFLDANPAVLRVVVRDGEDLSLIHI